MSRVFVCGLGVVSPAGWGLPAFQEALRQNQPLPCQILERPGWKSPLKACLVPSPVPRPSFLAHPRLRRSSAITHYAAAAGLEALAGLDPERRRRLGAIVCQQAGCVQYTQRFFSEVLKDPATASPMLFPETVFAAPGSHVGALLGNEPQLYTLIGDPASFLSGVSLAATWLEVGLVDVCLVIGAEEVNWVLADALWQFEHTSIVSGGAGALCLSKERELSVGVELNAITQVHTFSQTKSRARAAQAMRGQLPLDSPSDLLCDGCGTSYRANAAENLAWRDWTAARLSCKRIFGEGLMAAAAWQCVAACHAVGTGAFEAANVSLVGCNQQAIGARFVRSGTKTTEPVPALVPDNHRPDDPSP